MRTKVEEEEGDEEEEEAKEEERLVRHRSMEREKPRWE